MIGVVEVEKKRAVEQHSAQANQFAQRYRDLESNPYGSCFSYSRKRLDVWLARYLPSDGNGRRLLDLGCGTGDHLARYRKQGYDVAGVDGSGEMLRIAQLNNPGVEILASDVEHLPYPDRSFDYVICIEVLRYLPSPEGCVREIARVLRPGGVCLATAAPKWSLNGYWLVNRIAAQIRIGNLVQLRQFFTNSWQLNRSLAEAGFEQISLHGVYFGPVNWWERLAPWALPQLLRSWEPVDRAIADLSGLREFSNMFLVHATRNE